MNQQHTTLYHCTKRGNKEMAEYHLTADWVKGIAFDTHVNDFTVRMDTSPPEGDNTGPSPKRMVLAGLMCCTGMDVAALLRKMRVEFQALRIDAVAPITTEHPKTFEKVSLRYIVTGKDVKADKVRKAVELSQEKYCGVSAMIRKHCPIDWKIEIVEE